MERRRFLVRTGLTLGAAALTPKVALGAEKTQVPSDWNRVRDQFNLSRDYIQLAGFFLASHPTPVREAIDAHRRGFDENPFAYLVFNAERLEGALATSAAEYLGARPADIAFTDSTSEGLGLLYGNLRLGPGQEILTTTHDHYATDEALRYRADQTGTTVRRIPLYKNIATVSADEIVDTMIRAVTPKTRIVAVTWVHSSTGLKLPIRQMADALARVNASRAEADRALLCVDGVHGFGNQDVTVGDLGCDFLIAGCHKWLFGPRGTGLVWGNETAWKVAQPTVASFDIRALKMWEKDIPWMELPGAALMSPGGFKAFEYRWALPEAFQFHKQIGKRQIHDRVQSLNRQFKEGLAKMPKVKLQTPMADDLSGGIVCFEVAGLKPMQVVEKLWASKIVTTETPYATKYARASFSIFNTTDEVERTLEAIRVL
jgi:isopenicillin-N epimerase